MSKPSNKPMTVTLKTYDGKMFEVEQAMALQSKTLKHIIEDGCANDVIPLPNINADIFTKILEYCKKHIDDNNNNNNNNNDKGIKELEVWHTKFVRSLDMDTIFELILAANYLEMEGLLDLTCKKAAHVIDMRSIEEIRKNFNIQNDFTPQEEAQHRRQYDWILFG